MKAIVNYVSKSGKSVLLSISVPITGTKLHTTKSGFVPAEVGAYTVGEEITLPAGLKINEYQKPAEDGTMFNHLSFE